MKRLQASLGSNLESRQLFGLKCVREPTGSREGFALFQIVNYRLFDYDTTPLNRRRLNS